MRKVLLLAFCAMFFVSVGCAGRNVETRPATGITADLAQVLRPIGSVVRNNDGSYGLTLNRPVRFEVGSSELTDQSRRDVEAAARVLSRIEGIMVVVEGHTCSLGTKEYNQRLSRQRARSVANVLRGNGVARSAAVGLGSSQPIASNDTLEGRSQNRRVTFRIQECTGEKCSMKEGRRRGGHGHREGKGCCRTKRAKNK
ncbi:MAG: OmpA family protein [Elusimicrobia bacterium]|nr:OmpA family protein [Elusimicrobiota bacterium]